MADQLQLRGGTTAQHAGFTGALREVTVDTDKDVVVVHDGVTAGGIPAAKSQDITNTTFYFNDNTSGGSAANTYLLSPKTSTRTPTTLVDGLVLGFDTANANTGPSTANFAGLGVKNIKLRGGADPAASTILGRTVVVYDSTNDWFELQVPDACGVSQAWVDVTSSRTIGVTYTNTTGRPIQVVVRDNTSGGSLVGVNLLVGAVTVSSVRIDHSSAVANRLEATCIVPAGATYSATGNQGTVIWNELR